MPWILEDLAFVKTALISDARGNAVAVQAVLDDADKAGVDAYCGLGNSIQGGPRPARAPRDAHTARLAARLACLLALTLAALPGTGLGQPSAGASATTPSGGMTLRDGWKDFDFEIGTWRTHLRRLLRPLTGSTTWVEYRGTTVVRTVWDGRANLAELHVDGPAGRIEALSLRLYNPEARQWSLNFSNSAGGTLSTPMVGEFMNGRGEFYSQEVVNGRSVFVRFVISDLSRDSCRFEQAFSNDGGTSWEVNWIATDTRAQ